MGQYYKIVNLDKRQYLYSHTFGDGLKLREFGASGGGMMYGLALLLADGNGRGGGDFPSSDPIIGSWAGDRIVIAGDYANEGTWGAAEKQTLYHQCGQEYEDVSAPLAALIKSDV